MHGSKGRGWKRALATAGGSEHRRETGGIGATAYGSYRASPLPDRYLLVRARTDTWQRPSCHSAPFLPGLRGQSIPLCSWR